MVLLIYGNKNIFIPFYMLKFNNIGFLYINVNGKDQEKKIVFMYVLDHF